MEWKEDFAVPAYKGVFGTIVGIEPAGMYEGSGKEGSTMSYVSVEDGDGNLTRFFVTPDTYVMDFVTLEESMEATFYFRTDQPAVLIYPPQYRAAVVVPKDDSRFAEVAYFNRELVSDTNFLQLDLCEDTKIVTANNQHFWGFPGEQDLAVIYTTSTRSIPARTTPQKIVVLSKREEE